MHKMHESPPLRELRAIVEFMEASANMPEKARGTRWLQHKSRALHALISGYSVIVSYLEAMASDSRANLQVRPRCKNYVKKFGNFKGEMTCKIHFLNIWSLELTGSSGKII